jgi:hypothetical protein
MPSFAGRSTKKVALTAWRQLGLACASLPSTFPTPNHVAELRKAVVDAMMIAALEPQ